MNRGTSQVLAPLAGAVLVAIVALWVAAQDHVDVLGHSVYDSYTLQALAWRDGSIPLGENRPWLELAVYRGDYYVSFPPLPAVPMLLLSYIFGENTPSAAVSFAYFAGGLGATYVLLRRYQSAPQATLWLVFIALGGTILSLAVPGEGATGGVWFQAQLLGFFLTALAFLLVDGDRKIGWGIGLACLALAVGCRPFNIIYAPVLMLLLARRLPSVRSAVPYLIAPVVIGIAFGAYNALRFGNPMEFGHAYLPELAQAGEGMFVPSRIPDHLENVLKAPSIQDGILSFPPAGGFAFYLTNPMLVVGIGALLLRSLRRRADLIDLVLLATILVHALLLLSHRTNGGWQYGTRYLCDLLPALTFALARVPGVTRATAPSPSASEQAVERPAQPAVALAMGALIAFNVYGLVVFNAQ